MSFPPLLMVLGPGGVKTPAWQSMPKDRRKNKKTSIQLYWFCIVK